MILPALTSDVEIINSLHGFCLNFWKATNISNYGALAISMAWDICFKIGILSIIFFSLLSK
jgi:hypothetical protein